MRYKRQETGNFSERWEEFLNSLDTTGSKERARKFLTESGANEQTVGDWLRKKTFPSGIYLVKLWHLFNDNGDEVTNIARLFPEVRELGRALAHKKIYFDEIHKVLGYGRRTNTLRVLQGISTPSDGKRKIIRKFLDTIMRRNNANGDEKENSFDAGHTSCVYSRNNIVALVMKDMQRHASPSHMLRFASELERIIPVLEELVFHKNPRVRTDIHKVLGKEFERFQRLVRALASEDARAKILSEEGFKQFYTPTKVVYEKGHGGGE